jgi:hypothetical protein
VVTRRTLSILFASAVLFVGVALSVFEVIRADGVRPFVLFGALVMVAAGGRWLLGELVREDDNCFDP